MRGFVVVKSLLMRLQWLSYAFVLSLVLALLQAWALAEFLYWRYAWFDIPMHFLGGAAIAAFLVALLMHHRLKTFVVLMIVATIGWEVFEYLFGLPRESNYALDTALDLVMDTLGALTVYTAARLSVWRSK